MHRLTANFITLSLALVAIFLSSVSVLAQGVDDLMGTAEYRDFARKTRRAAEIKEGYVTNSEYMNIFARGKNGTKQLLEWLGTGSAAYKRVRADAENAKGFVQAEATYVIKASKDDDRINLKILLPKPASVSARNMGLFPEFSELQPPILEIDQNEKMEIDGFSANVYHHRKNGSCSLVVLLTKGALINFHTKTCANREFLIDLANSFDYKRLNQKLNS